MIRKVKLLREKIDLNKTVIVSFISLFLSFSVFAVSPITYYQEFNGNIDYQVTAGTFRDQPNHPYYSSYAASLRSTAPGDLTLPSGVNVQHAFLYWGGSGSTPDPTVTFDGETINATRTFIDNGYSGENYFGHFADVTSLVQTQAAGTSKTYVMEDLTVDNTGYYYSYDETEAVWTLVVIFDDPTITQNQTIYIYDGYEMLWDSWGGGNPPASSSRTFNITGINVGPSGYADITSAIYEGDGDLTNNESISVNGNVVSSGNTHNSSSNISGVGGSFPPYGLDVDRFDASSYVSPGDNSVTFTVSTGDDMIHISTIVVRVNTEFPPVAVDDTYTMPEDGNIILTPLDNDYDINEDPLKVITINGTTIIPGSVQSIQVPNGTVTVALDGTINFTPDENFHGQVTFSYEISDGNGGTDTAEITINITPVIDYPVATDNHSLSNSAGIVTQQVIMEDDGSGVDNDPDGSLDFGSIDLDPGSAGQLTTLIVPGEGEWMVDGAGNVTFTPETGFTNDPTPINYTISDNDGNLSNTANISVDYVPVVSNDISEDNPSSTPVVVDVTANDTGGDQVDPATVTLDAGSIPGSTCTTSDGSGDCIEVTVPGEGVWSVDEITGEVTFTPETTFTGDPQQIGYSVEDGEGNSSSGTVEITYLCSTVQLRVLMEGPHASAKTMTTLLNENHLLPGQDKDLSPNFSVIIKATHTPFGQPYDMLTWGYTGNMGLIYGDASSPLAVGTIVPYDADVVDWVLVTVREGGILPVNNVWQCAGWLKSNSDVTFPEECGCLSVKPSADYYIMVEQRNHLGVLSPSPVNKLNGTAILEWDFTSGDSYAPIPRKGQKEVATGIWAMYAANGEQAINTGAINSADQTVWKTDQNEINYLFGDFDLNVVANSADETIWKNNQNTTSGVIFN